MIFTGFVRHRSGSGGRRDARVLRDIRAGLAYVASQPLLVVLLLVSASLMFFAERDAQPEIFSSIPAALWWSVVTLTTVGYGDVYPITTAGKVIAGFMSILGIGMVALPAGIISASFVDEISQARAKQESPESVCPTCGRKYDDP